MIQHIIDAASLGGLYALMALGIALVFGVMRLVNFAYGELIMIGGYTLLIVSGAPGLLIIAAATGVVVLAAILMERFVFRPARKADPTTLLVMSFALSVGLQSLATLIAGARPKSVNVFSSLTKSIEFGSSRIGVLDLVTIALTIVLVAGLTLFLRRTVLGLRLRAAAEDFTMAQLLGVKANNVFATAFAASGVLAAAVAVILTVQTGTLSPTMGAQPVLIAFVATVIGGIGSLVGAAVGGFLLGVLFVVLQITLPPGILQYQDALVFTAVILILLVRPAGLFGSLQLEERV
jgi:branched-chain amino acid transport system permease protein